MLIAAFTINYIRCNTDSGVIATPDTIWNYWDFTPEQLAKGDFNGQM
jgi:hypothetical protein